MTIRIVRVPGFAAAAICVLVCSVSWHAASAAEQGFYVGASYGQVKSDADRASYDALAAGEYEAFGFTPAQSSAAFDTEDSGYGFFGGYRLFANLAFEGGYMDFGAVSYRDESVGTSVISGPGTWNQNLETNISGIVISVLGMLPLSYRSDLYARGGVMFATNEVTRFITNGIASQKDGVSESGTHLLVGIGGGFTFAEIYTARLEYQRIFDAGVDDLTGEADIDVISLAVTVTF